MDAHGNYENIYRIKVCLLSSIMDVSGYKYDELDKKIMKRHRDLFMLIQTKTFENILSQDKSVSVRHKNFQVLATDRGTLLPSDNMNEVL